MCVCVCVCVCVRVCCPTEFEDEPKEASSTIL